MRFATESKRMTMSAILSFSMALDILNTDYQKLSSYIKEISLDKFLFIFTSFPFLSNYVIFLSLFSGTKRLL